MLTNLLLVLLLLERIHLRWSDRQIRRAQLALLPRWGDIIDQAADALRRPVVMPVPEGRDH